MVPVKVMVPVIQLLKSIAKIKAITFSTITNPASAARAMVAFLIWCLRTVLVGLIGRLGLVCAFWRFPLVVHLRRSGCRPRGGLIRLQILRLVIPFFELLSVSGY